MIELKNYTQAFMAQELDLSIGGYGKIERDETDITLKRLNQIALILDTSLSTVLNFDSSSIFDEKTNKFIQQKQEIIDKQYISNEGLFQLFQNLNVEINQLKVKLEK